MPLKILIVPDKFKGTLTATAAAKAIARGWRRCRPLDLVEVLPVSDGGDGFGQLLGGVLGAEPRTVRTLDAAHRACRARWWWARESRTAVIESANIIGLARLPPGKSHPFDLDTFGLGAAVRAAATLGAERCFMGIGGSATNDGGFGLARALGWKFIDADGQTIEDWTQLHALARFRRPDRPLWPGELIVAVDVQNPLLGRRGATRVYGPQKGLRPEELEVADGCLRRLAEVFRKRFRRDCAGIPGSGAAGGLGFGLQAFLGARSEPGFDVFARFAGLEQRLCEADLVVTGEGSIDRSTFMGKGVGRIVRRCLDRHIPCIALAGVIEESIRASRRFMRAHALTDLTTTVNARSNPAHWLERLSERTAREWSAGDARLRSKEGSP